MKWYEEIRLTRRPMDEVGMTMTIREIFGNLMTIRDTEADLLFGSGWRVKAENLKRAGIVSYTEVDHIVTMSVTAPGDRRRDNQKRYASAKRKFLKGELNEKNDR